MNMREILDFEEKAVAGVVGTSEIEQYLDEVGDYLNEKSEEGKAIVLNRMREEDFVRLVREVKKALMVSMLHQGHGELLTLADMSGDVDPLLHTVMLGVLAILAEEEVI